MYHVNLIIPLCHDCFHKVIFFVSKCSIYHDFLVVFSYSLVNLLTYLFIQDALKCSLLQLKRISAEIFSFLFINLEYSIAPGILEMHLIF